MRQQGGFRQLRNLWPDCGTDRQTDSGYSLQWRGEIQKEGTVDTSTAPSSFRWEGPKCGHSPTLSRRDRESAESVTSGARCRVYPGR